MLKVIWHIIVSLWHLGRNLTKYPIQLLKVHRGTRYLRLPEDVQDEILRLVTRPMTFDDALQLVELLEEAS